LHSADHPAWRQERDYNPDLAPRLAAAYASIRRAPDRVASFREAGYHAVTLRDLPMCRQQRMNVCYLLGMAHAADDEYAQASAWLDGAVVLARALGDRSALVDLLYLRGLIALRMNLYSQALDDHRIALKLHRTLGRESVAVDGEQELQLLIAAAGFALSQEEFTLTRRLLSAARRVARRVAAAPSIVAYHDYVWAAYLEACGHPERALQPALRAVAAAAQNDSGAYYVVYMNTFAAHVATNLAATHEERSVGRVTHLDMASRCLRAARRSLEPHDRAGKGYIEIRQARLDALRAGHRAARALERVGAVEQLAREIGDGQLIAHALTVHGQILEERYRDWEGALRRYREAQASAADCGIPHAGLPARRALRRLEEQLPPQER
jgi:hypothetical protein